MSKECYNYKRKAKTAAKDFNYPECVLEKLETATTIVEIEKIMTNARKTYL